MANNPTAKTGKTYRAVFSYPSGMEPSKISTPYSLSVKGYGIRIRQWVITPTQRTLTVEFQIMDGAELDANAFTAKSNGMSIAPLAVGAGTLILAALVVLGLSMVYLSLDKVEEIVDSPAGGTFSLAVVALGAFIAWQYFKGR